LEQELRAHRTDPRRYRTSLGLREQTGGIASGGVLAGSDGTKTVAVALNHLHCYEPQALRSLPDGTMAVDAASDSVWLGARQGMFANFALCVATGQMAAAELESRLWAKLNHPLRAWPSASWFGFAKATEEIPVGPLAARWAGYDRLVQTVLTRTTNLTAVLGLTGLQTHGLFPRYWGEPGGYNEIANTPDPTPEEGWDDTYWGATWTDYHNTSALATCWAMRSGETGWLDEIGAPAAWRMLHTQIIHGAPEDTYFYVGQSPTGYGGYRADFNSSHAYFDNLFLYYWLTGDRSVVDVLTRGASTMRQYLYPGRPAVPCDPLSPPANEWAQVAGRVASQWIAAFRFVGLAGDDASFLEDYRGNLSRAVSQHYADLAALALRSAWNQGQPPPLGKEQGLYLSRLTAAVGRLNAAEARKCEFRREGARIRVSWAPPGQSGWLEAASDLAGAWQPLTNLWLTSNLWLDLETSGTRFFRLRIAD
jgi:hypothetical protein